MKILAVESSGLVASVAIVEDDNLLGEYTINYKKTHSQTLLPMLDEVAKMIELDLKTVDAIAVSSGPGSFTGLRIGSATAKGLALATDKEIVEVPTVDALAYNLWGTDAYVVPLMDARRQQTYTGVYRFEEDKLIPVVPQCAVGIDEIIDKVNAMIGSAQEIPSRVIFLGDGVPVFQEYIAKHCVVPYSYAPASHNKQSAASVAALGLLRYQEGKAIAHELHKPDYLRLSQAERERQGQARDFTV